MPIEMTTLDSRNREAAYETMLESWNQDWPQSFRTQFLDWRYGSRPGGETVVAMSGAECMGVIDSFIRSYRVGAEQVLFREPAD